MSTLQRDPRTRVRCLDEDGSVVDEDALPDLNEESMVEIYRGMRLARRFDQRAVSLQRQGRMGTYPPLSGQEGAQIASAYALAEDDWVFPSYREHGVAMLRGVSLERTLLYWMGHEAGNAALAELDVFPLDITIGDHLPHAVGWAWAAKLAGDDRAAVVHFGDGATSEGDFHEALNFAGVFDTPNVFFCNNNQWAISVPRDRQTASETLAQKAVAYGFEGVQVDGMDPLATYVVTKAAREKAVDPGDDERRPTLIEAVQYRFGAHTTADDPSIYREDREVERWRERDPIARFEAFLRERAVLDDDRIESIETEIDETLTALVERAERYEGDPVEMFDYTYEKPTERLSEQREYLQRLRETYGDDALRADE